MFPRDFQSFPSKEQFPPMIQLNEICLELQKLDDSLEKE